MMLYGCLNIYGQRKFLKRTLPALRKVVDYLVVIEGPYSTFPMRIEDRDLSYLQSMSDYFETKNMWESEIEKRNAYLRQIPDGAYALVVDGDELIRGKTPLLQSWGYIIPVHNPRGKMRHNLLRLFQKVRGLKYEGCHNYLWIGNILLNSFEWPIAESLKILHLKEKSEERLIAKNRYYEGLRTSERPWREKYGV